MPFCQECGAQLPDDALFCFECGARLESVSTGVRQTSLEETLVRESEQEVDVPSAVAEEMSAVLETQRVVREMLDRLKVPTQLPTARGEKKGIVITGNASSRSEAEEAINEFEKALGEAGDEALQGLDVDTLLRTGNFHYDNDEYDKALSYYRRALTINPDDATACFNMGCVYSMLGVLRKAVEMFEKFLKIEPESAEAWYNAGLAYARFGDYGKAIEMSEKAVEIEPGFAKAWYNAGLAYKRIGNLAEARERFLHAQAEFEKSGEAELAWRSRENAESSKEPKKSVRKPRKKK